MLSSLISSQAVALIGPDVSPLSLAELLARVPDLRRKRGVRYLLAEFSRSWRTQSLPGPGPSR